MDFLLPSPQQGGNPPSLKLKKTISINTAKTNKFKIREKLKSKILFPLFFIKFVRNYGQWKAVKKRFNH